MIRRGVLFVVHCTRYCNVKQRVPATRRGDEKRPINATGKLPSKTAVTPFEHRSMLNFSELDFADAYLMRQRTENNALPRHFSRNLVKFQNDVPESIYPFQMGVLEFNVR